MSIKPATKGKPSVSASDSPLSIKVKINIIAFITLIDKGGV